MVIRQRGERTQIAVLEDDVLVEHYVTQASATSFAGNVYLGRVQNVLPSMEAAFVDIGKGRNAVLYAGEVNWDAAGLSGKQRSIETAMKSGDKVLVQVTKDPIGHKGARLTQQINLPGRFLVYVPGGSMTGISRKLPDTERQRLKDILKKIVPDDAGVIIRTAAEGASEEELTRDVDRLQAQWDVIQKKAESTSNAPTLLYGEPDLAIRVIRDVFNEDFKSLVVQGDDAWDTVEAYVAHVSPELVGRLSRYTGEGDVFHDLRIDEQLAKALDRKVWLPSGGSLVIDRTEAMTVVDVNTGKFVGSGGNLEQTVTRNNMEAAEEIVRQLRLRDIGGIIVIDFIDMVLESNRDLVLRRLTECLGRDRTKHQVAEVTSLGLVQMTRKRVGQGLLEVFSEPCEHCRGRGVIVTPTRSTRSAAAAATAPAATGAGGSGGGRRGRHRRRRPPRPAPARAPRTAPGTSRRRSRRGRDATAGRAGRRGDAEATEGARSGGRRNRAAATAASPARSAPPRTPPCSDRRPTPGRRGRRRDADRATSRSRRAAVDGADRRGVPRGPVRDAARAEARRRGRAAGRGGRAGRTRARDARSPPWPRPRRPGADAVEAARRGRRPPSRRPRRAGRRRPHRRRVRAAAGRPAGRRARRLLGDRADVDRPRRLGYAGRVAPPPSGRLRVPPGRRAQPVPHPAPLRSCAPGQSDTSSDRGVSGVRSREGRWQPAQGGRGRHVHDQPPGRCGGRLGRAPGDPAGRRRHRHQRRGGAGQGDRDRRDRRATARARRSASTSSRTRPATTSGRGTVSP